MNYPKDWIPGQLLDLKRFTDGSYLAILLGAEYDPKAPEKTPHMTFASKHEAQEFVSNWYKPAEARERRFG